MSTSSQEPGIHELLNRLAVLEQAHARLQEELTHVRAGRGPVAEEPVRTSARPHPGRSSRRKALRKGLGVAVAALGAGALLEAGSGSALASGSGSFSSSISTTLAVKATGTKGAKGVVASSDTSTGVSSASSSYAAVTANGTNGAVGIRAISDSGFASEFHGNVTVLGTLSKGGGSFKIDHPLDPAHKYLSHSFVESPDMKNIYDGVVTLDANSEAEVTLPNWFDALNSDFRYQLTTLGGYAPVYIAEKIRDNRFKIADGPAGMEVSWMVTGIRQDAWANAHRIPVEKDKPESEQGSYLHPELYGQPDLDDHGSTHGECRKYVSAAL